MTAPFVKSSFLPLPHHKGRGSHLCLLISFTWRKNGSFLWQEESLQLRARCQLRVGSCPPQTLRGGGVLHDEYMSKRWLPGAWQTFLDCKTGKRHIKSLFSVLKGLHTSQSDRKKIHNYKYSKVNTVRKGREWSLSLFIWGRIEMYFSYF